MNPEILKSTLAALRKAGSIFGVLFSEGGETLFSDLAYTPDRVSEFTTVLDDIGYYFEQENRAPDTLAFSFDGGNLVILLRDNLRLVVLHHNADEVDFIAAAGGAFMKDFRMAKAVEDFSENGDVQNASKPVRTVDPTSPIAPVTA